MTAQELITALQQFHPSDRVALQGIAGETDAHGHHRWCIMENIKEFDVVPVNGPRTSAAIQFHSLTAPLDDELTEASDHLHNLQQEVEEIARSMNNTLIRGEGTDAENRAELLKLIHDLAAAVDVKPKDL